MIIRAEEMKENPKLQISERQTPLDSEDFFITPSLSVKEKVRKE